MATSPCAPRRAHHRRRASLGPVPRPRGPFKNLLAVPGERMAAIPPGSLDLVVSVLRAAPGPVRRRRLLAELEARGHRISLAGLNRIIEYGTRQGRLLDGSDGVRAASSTA